ncbi:MAG: hypothetical protein L3J53_01855 [Proteobacteria bacterium]|nr:hypothetical protein [Pseudomonadota bacterium]
MFLDILDPLADTFYDSSNPSFRMHKKYQENIITKDFSSISKLNLKGDEAILVLLTTGVKVPTKTTVKGAVVSSVLTLGLFSVAKVSVTNMNLILVSNKGEILWAGKVLRQGSFGSNWKQTILFNKTLKGFPVKKQK